MAKLIDWFKKKKEPAAKSEAVVAEKDEKVEEGKLGVPDEVAQNGAGYGLKEIAPGDVEKEGLESEQNSDGNSQLFACDVKAFLALDISKVAHNITLKDWNIYRNITTMDVEKSESSEIIQKLRENHDQLYFWTLETVLSSDDPRLRSKVIAKFLNIAGALLAHNDLNATHAIVTSLMDFAIFRMGKTWKKVTRNKTNLFKSLKALFCAEDNYLLLTKQMKEIHDVNNIVIPYMALFLRDHKALKCLQYDERSLTIRRNLILWKDINKLHFFRSDLEVLNVEYWTISPEKQSELKAVANERSKSLEPPKMFHEPLNPSANNLDGV